jgi:hypothetical protein
MDIFWEKILEHKISTHTNIRSGVVPCGQIGRIDMTTLAAICHNFAHALKIKDFATISGNARLTL